MIRPGDYAKIGKNHTTVVVRPFFYSYNADPFDDWNLDEALTVPLGSHVLVVASFPDGIPTNRSACGAIIMVADGGLWWWRWDKRSESVLLRSTGKS